MAHTDSRFEPDALRRFVRAYQRVQPLTIGELWAVAITLRVVLVENLRRLAERIVRGRAARQAADALADELLGLGSQPGAPRAPGLERLGDAPLATAFAVQLVQRLRDQDPAVTPALRWLDGRLAAQGTSADDMVRVEHQRQGAMNVTVRNVIPEHGARICAGLGGVLRERELGGRGAQAGTDCAALDFPTRDRYRHAIEELARARVGASSTSPGRPCIGRARPGRARGARTAARRAVLGDPGYYLIGGGRHEPSGLWPSGRRQGWRLLLRLYVAAATPGYIGTIIVLTGLVLAARSSLPTRGRLGPASLLVYLAAIPRRTR